MNSAVESEFSREPSVDQPVRQPTKVIDISLWPPRQPPPLRYESDFPDPARFRVGTFMQSVLILTVSAVVWFMRMLQFKPGTTARLLQRKE